MKLHIGVDDVTGVIHSLETTAANEHDLNVADQVLQGQVQLSWCDAGYPGCGEARGSDGPRCAWKIAERPGKRKTLSELKLKAERMKAGVRAKVEHSFRRIKIQFGYNKVRYCGWERTSVD